jgi:predicted phage terminase large subunit-like protein
VKRPQIVPLMQAIPRITPKWSEPRHLAKLVDVFERIARGEEVHVVASVPPRHEKTETVSHGVAWLLFQNPAMRVGYATYGQRLSEKKSRRIRQLAERVGVPLDKDAASKADWRTGVEEGGVWATSVGGAAVGEGFDLQVWDDLVKDRISAEAALSRERTYEWVTDVALTRSEPRASVVVIMHRWHVDDVAGRLLRDGWEEIHLPALNEAGEALLPERYPAAALAKIRERVGEYAWESLYMGRPRSRGGRVFADVHTYVELPAVFDAKSIGVDFAYSTRTHADYSVAVVLGRAGEAHYVLDVVRMQVTAPAFHAELERLRREHPGAELVGYVSGTEKGAVDMMRSQGLEITTQPAVGDKFTRAQPAAAGWNAGKVLVPAGPRPWRDAFVSELAGFTGIGDRHDDQVDALAAAFDRLRVDGLDDGELLGFRRDGRGSPWTRFGGGTDRTLLAMKRATARAWGLLSTKE